MICLALLLILLVNSNSSRNSVFQFSEAAAIMSAGQYVQFEDGYEATHDCLCTNNIFKYEYNCEIRNKSLAQQLPNTRVTNCSELPVKTVVKFTISCAECSHCALISLLELTRGHNDSSSRSGDRFLPPREVRIDQCRVDNQDAGRRRLRLENVNISAGIELAQFGIPERPGVGGYYTANASYPDNFNRKECKLTDIELSHTNMRFLPSYLTHKCRDLRSVKITSSPIIRVSVLDLPGLGDLDSLTMNNCSLTTFASDAIHTVLDCLDDYLMNRDDDATNEFQSLQQQQNSLTIEALKKLRQMRDDTGRLTMINYLYDALDSSNIPFSLLFAFRSTPNSRECGGKYSSSRRHADIPYAIGLNHLDLAYNNLTEIPPAISLFGYLTKVNLSHNQISSLYRSWLCWSPSIDPGNSSRHCYWFRGSRATLKRLDLSFNQIDRIGEIQPWFGIALQELYLQNNKIANIDPRSFSHSSLSASLLKLVLDANLMQNFQLNGLNRLEYLSIANNQVTSIELTSLPNSTELAEIDLSNGKISAIAPNAFADLPGLQRLNLSANNLQYLNSESFVTSNRTTPGSRVELLIDNQQPMPVCDCNHVYERILYEEFNSRPPYQYPQITDESRSATNCSFYSEDTNSTVNASLNKKNQRDFLCLSTSDTPNNIPSKYCNYSNQSGTIVDSNSTCRKRCAPNCRCYHNRDWSFSDLNCSGMSGSEDLIKMTIDYPVKYIDMSNVPGTTDYFRRISSGTFKWNSSNLYEEFSVLYLQNSSVHSIEDNAFNFKPPLVQLYLNNNKIREISASALCPLNSTLEMLRLENNQLDHLDPSIIDSSCLANLNAVYLAGNPWICSCEPEWLDLHNKLIEVSKSTQVVADYDRMTCTIEQSVIDACLLSRTNAQFWPECESILADNCPAGTNYSISDKENLPKLCGKIVNAQKAQTQFIIATTIGGAIGLILLGLLGLAIRRRHRLLAVVRVVLLLRYQRDRRLSHHHATQANRDSSRYDAMLWAADSDQNRLADVLNRLRSVTGGSELELCMPHSFVYTSLCSSPLTYFDTPVQGARYSRKVVVALSERFLDTEYLSLCAVIRELDSLGRSPFKDIIFLRLNRSVSLPRHRTSLQPAGRVGRAAGVGPDDVKAFKALQRILASSDIGLDSVDWEYRLLERIRRGQAADSKAVPACKETLLETRQVSPPERDDQQSLVLNIQSSVTRLSIISSSSDFPPFYSDQVAELFVVSSAPPDSGSVPTETKTIVDQIVRRVSEIRLGTNDQALISHWPNSFEPAATPSDQINGYMMKRTRQFVLLLSNRVLNWFKDEPEMVREFESFLAANTFRRRLLVILVGQVDNRSRLRYQALANQRLSEGCGHQALNAQQNWWDMTTDGDSERLGNWLDAVLYKRGQCGAADTTCYM